MSTSCTTSGRSAPDLNARSPLVCLFKSLLSAGRLGAVMALVRSKWSGYTGPPKKRGPPKQNIALFFHINIMTVTLCPHLKFRTKVGIEYSIVSNDFFRDHYIFGTKKS